MYPVLFESLGGGIQSYLFVMSLAYFTGLGVWRLETRRLGVSWDSIINLSLLAMLFGLLGARLLYILTRLDDLLKGGVAAFSLWQGGIVYFGGFVFGFLAVATLAPRFKIDRVVAMNTGAVAICFAHAVGRLGCFLNGCCYGDVCDLPWAVTFSDLRSSAPLGLSLHPVQLYESVALVLLGLVLARNARRPIAGFLSRWGNFRAYLFGYGVLRFALEFYRGDLVRGFYMGLSTSQWISLILIAAALSFKIR
jgi:phosphatidylglycerol---prolipoprotein diacylglyceryl transferase